MSQITEVGVGSFVGSSNLVIDIPGLAENEVVLCNWGPGIGFYLTFISFIILLFYLFHNRFKNIEDE